MFKGLKLISLVLMVYSNVIMATESIMGFNEIVDNLKQQNDYYSNYNTQDNAISFDQWEVYAGLSGGASYVPLKYYSNFILTGFTGHLGFSFENSSWNFEGSLLSYNSISKNSKKLNLFEYDLKTFYATELNFSSRIKLGTGFASRFLEVQSFKKIQKFKTPSLIFLSGYDYFVNRSVSIGLEALAKLPLIKDSLEKTSSEVNLRLDAYF